ncbi:hypothetical protein [Paraburkholderia nodosa]|uniref:hypothetical protein n=1 Tax=Paraburkholderia nodosa TaxID=392320 RepID=UPI000841A74B|nr:hypothetical protein [Paraburkholderia nodosa]
MLKQTLKALGRPVWNRLKIRIDGEIERQFATQRAATEELHHAMALQIDECRKGLTPDLRNLGEKLNELQDFVQSLPERFEKRNAELYRERIYLPPGPILGRSDPFMLHSTCSVVDMLHPRYAEILGDIHHHFTYHRKTWEWVFVIHHLEKAGVLVEGSRGLGFGIGLERLPALFAKKGCSVLATDAPPEIGVASGWSTTGQHSSALDDLRYPSIVSNDIFNEKVSHRFCDMNAIPDDLTGFDFTWSSCCFEHLGSLEAGMQFVINSVEKTLKPGGIAVHTTEFNLSSEDETVESGPTVLYRRRDMEELVRRLRARGHDVQPFSLAPYSHPLDFHVDVPPYSGIPHMKLRLGKYAATSVGICVRRGQ